MELRQLRYFVRIVELGSIGRAAREMGLVPSALSQQISGLEKELSIRLLQRTTTGVTPTPAGLAFFRQAQMSLRYADTAIIAAREARMAGVVSVGFPSTTASLLALPLVAAVSERYPDIRLRLVEGLTGYLSQMLNARTLDLGILFHSDGAQQWSTIPILNERLFLFARRGMLDVPDGQEVGPAQFAHLPMAMTSKAHGLRTLVDAAFARAKVELKIGIEIDGLSTLMDVIQAHNVATIQPGAALGRLHGSGICVYPINDPHLYRHNLLTSVSDDELSPPALAVRVVLAELMRKLVRKGQWPGASIHEY